MKKEEEKKENIGFIFFIALLILLGVFIGIFVAIGTINDGLDKPSKVNFIAAVVSVLSAMVIIFTAGTQAKKDREFAKKRKRAEEISATKPLFKDPSSLIVWLVSLVVLRIFFSLFKIIIAYLGFNPSLIEVTLICVVVLFVPFLMGYVFRGIFYKFLDKHHIYLD